MKKPTQHQRLAVSLTAIGAALAVFSSSTQAQVTFDQITNGLVSFYPLDYVQTNGEALTTPDHVGGRDLLLDSTMSAANIIPANRGIGDPAASVNCVNLDQSGGHTVIYYSTQGQDPLDITNPDKSDFLPFCDQLNATMSFWIKGAAVGTDTRFFGECGNGGHGDPLYLWGDHDSAPGRAHLLFRQQELDPAGYISMTDGSRELPSPGYYQGQGGEYTENPVLDGTWHLFTVTIDTNGIVEVYVDDQRDPGALGTYTDTNGISRVCQPMIVTNTYYTTNAYPYSDPPGQTNPAPNGYVKWVFNDTFQTGATAFGGFRRGNNNSGGVPCEIDDIAFWNRALDSNEIAFVYTNGLPDIPLTRPLKISKFAASVVEVGQGNTATLEWNVTGAGTNAGSIEISGVGDVTSLGNIASTDVVVNGDETFTLTVKNDSGQSEKAINVKVLPGVDSNWHLVQRFDGLYTDTQAGIGPDIFGNKNWYSAVSSYAGNFDRWNVVTVTNNGAENEVLSPRTGYTVDETSLIGFDSRGALAQGELNALTVGPDQTRTLFFRFSLRDPESFVQAYGVYGDMDASIGLTDYNFWGGPEGANADLTSPPPELYSKGPFVNIVRSTSDGTFTHPEPFNLRAFDYDGTGTVSNYSYIASVDSAGLETNVNYMLWMDIENRNTTYDVSTSNTVDMPLYSVYLQKQGDANRTLLFSGFRGNRNFAPPTDLGPNQATPYLSKFFANMGAESIINAAPGAYFETNMIALDDIYLSKDGVESSIPRLFDLTSIVRDSSGVTITWNSLGPLFQGNTYTVQRKMNIQDATWTTIVSDLPSGGDTTSYTDTSVGDSDSAYYRIVWP